MAGSVTHTCRESANPRHKGFCDCGKKIHYFTHPLVMPHSRARNGSRDPYFERQFLAQAERLAGMAHNGYAERVQERLHRAERELGQDSYLEHSMLRLVAEIDEEGLDVGGWSTVAALAAYVKIMDDDTRGQVHLLLQQLAAYGPLISRLCQQIREALE